MRSIALLFSGQGSQYAGMGKELVENYARAREIFTLGSSITGVNLSEKIENNELESTLIVQPAVFAMSLAALMCFRETTSITGQIAVAGHSLGEYAALVACGALTPEDGFKLIKIRSEVMDKAARNSDGGMAAVLGCDEEAVREACREITKADKNFYIEAVNFNSPGQVVIAGTSAGLAKAEEVLKSKGAKRIVRLNTAAAFHSALMKDAAEEFREKIKGIANFKKPETPFYSNITGKKLELSEFSESGEFADYLARHICSPVRFSDQLYSMEKDGFDVYLELGPGKVLTGLVKKTLPNAVTCNIEDLKSLQSTKETLNLA